MLAATKISQANYLNSVVEQGHMAIKLIARAAMTGASTISTARTPF